MEFVESKFSLFLARSLETSIDDVIGLTYREIHKFENINGIFNCEWRYERLIHFIFSATGNQWLFLDTWIW